jgi:hypothetical protein
MIYTSYFSINSKHPNAVSISLYSPKWYEGNEYKLLAPQKEMFRKWKDSSLSNEWYKDQFYKTTLINLDVHKVARDMEGKVMLCYEKSGDFCHRHLVADWLREAGYEVEEIKYITKTKPYVKKERKFHSNDPIYNEAPPGAFEGPGDAAEYGASSY